MHEVMTRPVRHRAPLKAAEAPPYNRIKQATVPAATTTNAAAQTGLINRGTGVSFGINFTPVTMGRTKFCRFMKRVPNDSEHMQHYRALDQLEVYRVDVAQPIAPVLADQMHQRPLRIAVVIGEQTCPRLHTD